MNDRNDLKKSNGAMSKRSSGKRTQRSSKYRGAKEKVMTKGKDEGVMDSKPGGNDPRWWGTPEFIQSVSKFNFSNPLGKPIPFGFYNDSLSNVTYTDGDYIPTIPGVMAIDILPTIGVATGATDAVNTFVRSVYTKLRSTNNQSAPYQAPDLGIYFMAIDSVHMIIEQLIRVYGVARTYSAMNRYLPQAILTAMGIDPNASGYNLYSNLADFRAEILNLLLKIQTLAIPKGMHLNERHRELVKYIYMDGQTSKSQIYFFRTAYLYKYDEAGSELGGRLIATTLPTGVGVNTWISLAHTLIDALLTSQDFAIISGDIIKSFGYEALYNMPYFDETYSVLPVYNPEILMEIHNIKFSGDRWDENAFNITQNAGANELYSAPYCVTTTPSAGPIFPVIDVPIENPDSDSVMIATRLTHCGTCSSENSKYKYVPTSLGSELPISCTIYWYNKSGTLKSFKIDSNMYDSGGILKYAPLSYFDWAPLGYIYSPGTDGLVSIKAILGDLNNYTVMSPGDIQKLHEMAIFGALTLIDVDTVGMPKAK